MKKFKIGDKVQLIDGNMKCQIISLTQYKAIVLDEYGFDEEVLLSNLTLQTQIEDYEESFDKIDWTVIKKDFSSVKISSKKHQKRKVLEVDLHIHHLTSSTRNMTNHEMVLLQLKQVKTSLRLIDKHQYSKIVFIHGIGSGKLKKELETVLRRNQIQYQDASFEKYGRGALEVLV